MYARHKYPLPAMANHFPRSPSNEQEYNVYVTLMKTYAQSCIDNSTPKGIVAHLSAAYTAQDWNSIRDALGYEKLDYIGVS